MSYSEHQAHGCVLYLRCQSSCSACMCSFGRHSASMNGCRHLMIALGLLVNLCIIFTCPNIYYFHALSPVISPYVTENQIRYFEFICVDWWEGFPPFASPGWIGSLLFCSLPRRVTVNGINQLHCPAASS